MDDNFFQHIYMYLFQSCHCCSQTVQQDSNGRN